MVAVVGGYHPIALPLRSSVFKRYIYVKAHAVKENEQGGESALAVDRTIYVVNLPQAADAEWLRECFSSVGAIQHVVPGMVKSQESSDPLMAKTAHIVFKSKAAAAKVLKVNSLDSALPTTTTALISYLEKYKANKPGLAAVKELADRFMADFDAQEEEDLRKREELKNQVDDDGFQIVVNTKKRSAAAAEDLARPSKKQKAKELPQFYRFQMREKKRDQLKSLRERFEEDRQMVEKLKKANKFKPE